jgi:hypothetical protein
MLGHKKYLHMKYSETSSKIILVTILGLTILQTLLIENTQWHFGTSNKIRNL